MPQKAPKGWYDISVVLKQGMVYLPADPVAPKIYRISDIAKGDKVTASVLEILSHTGTHVDTPQHFLLDGSTITDMPLDATVGPARVIEIKDSETIKVEELEPYNIRQGERILFKTRNSPISYESEKFVEGCVYLSSEAAKYLGEKKPRLIGIDLITIGNFSDYDSINQTHLYLLENGVYILEGLALAGVPAGEYELLCLPLRLERGDAAPSRALLRPLYR